jgi:hypothetical protein
MVFWFPAPPRSTSHVNPGANGGRGLVGLMHRSQIRNPNCEFGIGPDGQRREGLLRVDSRHFGARVDRTNQSRTDDRFLPVVATTGRGIEPDYRVPGDRRSVLSRYLSSLPGLDGRGHIVPSANCRRQKSIVPSGTESHSENSFFQRFRISKSFSALPERGDSRITVKELP